MIFSSVTEYERSSFHIPASTSYSTSKHCFEKYLSNIKTSLNIDVVLPVTVKIKYMTQDSFKN